MWHYTLHTEAQNRIVLTTTAPTIYTYTQNMMQLDMDWIGSLKFKVVPIRIIIIYRCQTANVHQPKRRTAPCTDFG